MTTTRARRERDLEIYPTCGRCHRNNDQVKVWTRFGAYKNATNIKLCFVCYQSLQDWLADADKPIGNK